MNRNTKMILSSVLLLAVLIAYIARCHAVNRRLQDPPVISYRMGEEVSFGRDILMDGTMEGYSITVNHAEVLTYPAFLEKYEAEDEYTYVPDKIYDVNVTLKNDGSNAEAGVNLLFLYVQGTAVCAGLDTNLFGQVNPNLDGVYAIALRENSEIELNLPFALQKDTFRPETWEHLDEFPMDFVATLYPEKKVIHLWQ